MTAAEVRCATWQKNLREKRGLKIEQNVPKRNLQQLGGAQEQFRPAQTVTSALERYEGCNG